MIEFTGDLQYLLRRSQQDANVTVRRALAKAGATLKNDGTGESAESSSHGLDERETETRLQESSMINFEYLPAGKLRLNQEERRHIIDFFE